MKNDTQHLDFLISQYVDGCLEGTSKKSVEQKMLADPGARALYVEHRETQDLLDDWGNRIPLIHWDEFDQKLAARLEHEVVGGERASIFRRWIRPMAAAAALFVAATLGYAWHALSHTPGETPERSVARASTERPHAVVEYPEAAGGNHPSHAGVVVEEAGAQLGTVAGGRALHTTIDRPADEEAAQSLRENVAYGLQNVADKSNLANTLPSAVAVGELTTRPASDDKSNDAAFPQ